MKAVQATSYQQEVFQKVLLASDHRLSLFLSLSGSTAGCSFETIFQDGTDCLGNASFLFPSSKCQKLNQGSDSAALKTKAEPTSHQSCALCSVGKLIHLIVEIQFEEAELQKLRFMCFQQGTLTKTSHGKQSQTPTSFLVSDCQDLEYPLSLVQAASLC